MTKPATWYADIEFRTRVRIDGPEFWDRRERALTPVFGCSSVGPDSGGVSIAVSAKDHVGATRAARNWMHSAAFQKAFPRVVVTSFWVMDEATRDRESES